MHKLMLGGGKVVFDPKVKVTIPERVAFVNITPQLEELVRRSGVTEGLLLCNAMHITASVFINAESAGFFMLPHSTSTDGYCARFSPAISERPISPLEPM